MLFRLFRTPPLEARESIVPGTGGRSVNRGYVPEYHQKVVVEVLPTGSREVHGSIASILVVSICRNFL